MFRVLGYFLKLVSWIVGGLALAVAYIGGYWWLVLNWIANTPAEKLQAFFHTGDGRMDGVAFFGVIFLPFLVFGVLIVVAFFAAAAESFAGRFAQGVDRYRYED
jgi:TRAP-type C4-dicarboxylate transport system permease small subunit